MTPEISKILAIERNFYYMEIFIHIWLHRNILVRDIRAHFGINRQTLYGLIKSLKQEKCISIEKMHDETSGIDLLMVSPTNVLIEKIKKLQSILCEKNKQRDKDKK